MGLDADGYLPTFMDMTDGKVHEVNWAPKKLSISILSWAHPERITYNNFRTFENKWWSLLW